MDRRDRRNDTCEVFTPQETVREMLSSLPDEMFEADKTFLDNSCGNGNMLVEVLLMKIEKAPEEMIVHNSKIGDKIKFKYMNKCIESLYGTDMMEDNIVECKNRLMDIYWSHVGGFCELGVLGTVNDLFTKNLKTTLDNHIVCTKMEDWDYEKWCPIHEKLF